MKKYIIAGGVIATLFVPAFAIETTATANTEVKPEVKPGMPIRQEVRKEVKQEVKKDIKQVIKTESKPEEGMMRKLDVSTGDANLDAEIKAMQTEMEAKLKVIRDDYQARIKAKLEAKRATIKANGTSTRPATIKEKVEMMRASSTMMQPKGQAPRAEKEEGKVKGVSVEGSTETKPEEGYGIFKMFNRFFER